MGDLAQHIAQMGHAHRLVRHMIGRGDGWGRVMKSRSLLNKTLILLVVVGGILGHSFTSEATTIPSTIHGFARDLAPQDGTGDGTNPGGVEVLNGYGPLGAPQDHGIIEFDISGLSASISSATLTLPIVSNHLSVSTLFFLLGYTGDGLLTNNDYSSVTSGIGAFSINPGQTGSLDFDVTSFINAQLALNDPLHFAGFSIEWAGAPSSTDFILFGWLSPPNFPTLDVELSAAATPLPAALPLFAGGLGVIGLLALRRKKRIIYA